jgi:hypothetical protein
MEVGFSCIRCFLLPFPVKTGEKQAFAIIKPCTLFNCSILQAREHFNESVVPWLVGLIKGYKAVYL